MSKFTKSFELLLRRILNWILSGKHAPVFIDEPQLLFNSQNTGKILLLRHDRIGDVLISTPFLSILRKLLPRTQIDILLSFRNKSASDIVIPFTDNIYIYPKSALGILTLIRSIRNTKYDLIIDLLDNESTTANLFLRFSQIPHKLSFNKKNIHNYSVTVPLPDKTKIHPALRLLSLLLPLGYNETNDIKLKFPLAATFEMKAKELLGSKISEFRLGINLSGSTHDKYWGKDNFIALIDKISESFSDLDIVIFSTKNLKDEADVIAKATRTKTAPNVDEFMLYASMLKQCDLIITPDTSAVHIASAFEIPVIALYVHQQNATDMPWTPINTKYKALIGINNIMQIQVSEVHNAFSETFREIHS